MLEICWSNFPAIMIGRIKKEKARVTLHIVMQILNNTDIEMVKCQILFEIQNSMSCTYLGLKF